MKNQNQVISVDNFRLQLSQLAEQEEELRKQIPIKQEHPIYKIQPFPISISRVASAVYFPLTGVFIYQTLDVYLTLYNNIQNGQSPFYLVQLSSLTSSMPSVGYYFTALLLGLILISLLFQKRSDDEGILVILTYIGSNTFPYLRYILKIALIVSSYFAMGADMASIILFVITAIIVYPSVVLLQNYTLRKDQFCCKSIEFFAIFRIISIAAYTTNMVSFNIVTQRKGLIGFIIFHLIASTIILICYYSFGLTIYRHPIPRYVTYGIVILYSTLSLCICYDVFLTVNYGYNMTSLHIISPIILFGMLFFHMSTLSRISRYSNSPKNTNITNKVYFFLNKYEGSYQDEEYDCEIRGIMFAHKQQGCHNPECVVNKQFVYDSKKKKYCSISKIGPSKVSLIKFYVKCLFETYLQENKNTDRMLDYLQFLYLKLKNIYFGMKLVTQLEQNYLSFFQKLRLIRLKDYLINQSNSFSSDLFLKALSMQNIVKAEENFCRIQKSIDIVLRRNELFWKYIQRNQVNLSDILCTIEPNFRLVDDINEDWTKIGNYFQINRRWKFYYLCFTVYIKNEKLVPSMLQDFGNSVEYDSIFKTSNYFIDKTTDKQLLYNSIMLFEQNTCFIHVICDQQKMNITKVSNYFSTNFGYDRNDIINSPLQVLMTPTVKKFHSQMFMKWIKDGRNNNQDFYTVNKVYPLTKKGYINPTFKFYKAYLKIQGDIEYIGMFKRNRQDELIIIANQEFQIQGITEALGHKLNLEKGDYVYMKGINLLSMLPSLAKYTKFANRIRDKDQDFMDNDENQNYFRKQSYSAKDSTGAEGEMAINILHQKQSLNLVNIKLTIPNDLQSALDHYNTIKTVQKLQTFAAMKDLHAKIKRSKNFSRFKVEINIREKNMMEERFFEIEINQIQENNRLQKIRKAEQGSQHQMDSSRSLANIQDNKLGDIDLQLFFHVSKRKSKVVLFPSNNIFLKEENNKALLEISHIKNITLSIKFSILLFLLLTLAEVIVQLIIGAQIKLASSQYYWISRHQKATAVLNTLYNMQHMPLDNGIVESFFIVSYTHQLIASMQNEDFLLMIYDQTKNTAQKFAPYFQTLDADNLQNEQFPTIDQFQLFYQLYQAAISLHRMAELSGSDPLQNRNYYTVNNYNQRYYVKTNNIKSVLVSMFQTNYSILSNMTIFLGLAQGILLLLCFLFILSRLLNVSRGYTELLSIFVQMDNLDIRKIFRFMQFTINLFSHLNDKHQKMTVHTNSFQSSFSNVSEYDKQNSELSYNEQLNMISVNANLNKKIKKIQLGDQINNMRTVALVLIIVFLVLVGGALLAINVYASVSLQNYKSFQQLGYSTMQNGSVINILLSGVFQKYRNASIYVPQKYQVYLETFTQIQSSNLDISVSSGNTDYQKLYRTIHYQNFCQSASYIMNDAISWEMSDVCGGSDIQDVSRCAYLLVVLDIGNMINMCTTIQNAQLTKGSSIYYKYILDIITQFLNNQGSITAKDIIQLNWGQIIIGFYDEYLMLMWKTQSEQILATRQQNIIIITVVIFIFIIVIHLIFVEYLIADNLKKSYEVFRKIHQHLIPQFVINKEKIIKAKLIKEGFMKE